ncbi:amino acid ABC transporter permease [Anaerofilum sp. BX8]|uniref:Amino acid ABC transporter permease n=1 Tax=Anaerofilum hominis TaxID=2763016 RepID=A0A923I4H9_9FIRM|nr:amino acid ABC transporter permease [Anaerofilum hominis]MBC5580143.1 amino acid ABC transporter permease [Anaerofilum hominis]
MDLSYIAALMPALMQGLWQTLKIFALTLVFSLPLGLVFTLGSISRVLPLRWLARGYIWIFRGTPLMLQLFFVYYGLPFLGLTFDRFPAAVLTFVLNYAAYFAEIYRGGIQSIDRGQHEAAKTLGFTPWQTMRLIIIPQTVSRVIPPVCNETITLVKDTALVTAIGVGELLKAAQGAVNRDVNITAYVVAAVIYLAITFVMTMVYERLEKYFSRHQKKEA